MPPALAVSNSTARYHNLGLIQGYAVVMDMNCVMLKSLDSLLVFGNSFLESSHNCLTHMLAVSTRDLINHASLSLSETHSHQGLTDKKS